MRGLCYDFAFFGLKSCLNLGGKTEKSDYYILTNQISKMNKMVVLEQNTLPFRKPKWLRILGKEVSSNSIITYTKTTHRFLMILTR
jgi:hypothetical protein